MTERKTTPLLLLRDLRVSFGGAPVVDGVSLELAAGECVALVGESGSGKSLTARALLGLLPEGAEASMAALEIDGAETRHATEREWRERRGAQIALVSQDALVALDPLRRIEAEVAEPVRIHQRGRARADLRSRVMTLLESVGFPEPEQRARRYPHELSGGQRQRALLASALAADPGILVADEPTTALDATVQERILRLLRDIADRGTAVLFISHDIQAVRRVADRVVVLRGGRVVEAGTSDEVLSSPREEYTRDLIRASSPERMADHRAPGDAEVVFRAREITKAFDEVAVRSATFEVRRGSVLGIVGESGSGKTTLARMLVGIEHPDAGTLDRSGSLAGPRGQRAVQLVHQNPLGAFDPRWSVRRSLAEALDAGGVPRAQRDARADALLREVGLDPSIAGRRPRQLSGGQRQRAAIARALAADPEVLVLDEPVSALDPTVRERILRLLARLRSERGLTMVFVSHALDVVAALADDVLVMKDGDVVEQGSVDDVFTNPRHPFTQELLRAADPRP